MLFGRHWVIFSMHMQPGLQPCPVLCLQPHTPRVSFVKLHCTNDKQLKWPKLLISVSSAQLTYYALLRHQLNCAVCNLPPGRGLSDQRASLLSFPSFRNHQFSLSILYCLKIIVIYCLWQKSQSGASYFIMVRSESLPFFFFLILATKQQRNVDSPINHI